MTKNKIMPDRIINVGFDCAQHVHNDKRLFVRKDWILCRVRHAGFETDIEYATSKDLANMGYVKINQIY